MNRPTRIDMNTPEGQAHGIEVEHVMFNGKVSTDYWVMVDTVAGEGRRYVCNVDGSFARNENNPSELIIETVTGKFDLVWVE